MPSIGANPLPNDIQILFTWIASSFLCYGLAGFIAVNSNRITNLGQVHRLSPGIKASKMVIAEPFIVYIA
jgi:hypothetical protein